MDWYSNGDYNMIKMIYASDVNGVIGKDNKLPWHLPSDLKRFKELTFDQYVVMGRKTYESLPERFRPLPGRINIVLSRENKIDHPEVITLGLLKSFLTVARMPDSPYADKDIWIIGGASIYEAVMDYVDEIHHTQVLGEYEGDAFFDMTKHNDAFETITHQYVNLPEDKGIDYYYNVYKRQT